MKKIGLIRVVTMKSEEEIGRHGRLLMDTYPDLEVLSRCIPDQAKGIYDDESENIAIPKIVDLGERLCREERLDALLVSCAADPGVSELRKRVQVPVIGAGTSAASLARAFSDKVATMGITEGTPAEMKRVLGDSLVGEIRPEGVKNTLDLLTEAGRKNAFDALERLLAKSGAKVVALACTGFATIGLAPELERKFGVPVLDPVLAAGVYLRFYVGRKA